MEHLILNNRFPAGKRHALTLSYDDGRAADRRLAALLDRYGIRGTFCLNSGMLGREDYVTPEELPSLYRRHEVASHTVHHPNLTGLSPQEQREEIWQDRRTLERLWGRPVSGFSYPYGGEDPQVRRVLADCGIRYARTVAATGAFERPRDLLRWHPTCRHREGLAQRTEDFLRRAEGEESLFFFLWGHSYEFDRDDNWSMMEDFCARISRREDTWYATNGEAADYFTAEQGLEITENAIVNPASIPVWLTVDGETVRVPERGSLTLSSR